jgi:hypothetical protein
LKFIEENISVSHRDWVRGAYPKSRVTSVGLSVFLAKRDTEFLKWLVEYNESEERKQV